MYDHSKSYLQNLRDNLPERKRQAELVVTVEKDPEYWALIEKLRAMGINLEDD